MIKELKGIKGKTLGTFDFSFNDYDGKGRDSECCAKINGKDKYCECSFSNMDVDQDTIVKFAATFKSIIGFDYTYGGSSITHRISSLTFEVLLDDKQIKKFKNILKDEVQGNINNFLSSIPDKPIIDMPEPKPMDKSKGINKNLFRVKDIELVKVKDKDSKKNKVIRVYLKNFEKFEKDVNDFIMKCKKQKEFAEGFIFRNKTEYIDFCVSFSGGIACRTFLQEFSPACIPEYKINKFIEGAKDTGDEKNIGMASTLWDNYRIVIVDLFKFYEGYYGKPHKDAGIRKSIVNQLNARFEELNKKKAEEQEQKQKEEVQKQIEALQAQLAALNAK